MRDGRLVCTGNERGVLLPGALILLVVTGLFAFSFLRMSSHEHTFVEYEYQELKSLWACEEALSRARAELQTIPLERIPDALQGITLDLVEYSITRVDSLENTFRVITEVYGEDDEPVQRLVETIVPERSSQYFMMFDSPGNSSRGPFFFTGDVIDGRVHSNTNLNIAGSPRFTDAVARGFPEIKGDNFPEIYGYAPIIESNQSTWNADIYRIDLLAENIRRNATMRPLYAPESVARITFNRDEFELEWRTRKENTTILSRSRDDNYQYSNSRTHSLAEVDGMYFDGDVEVRGTLEGRVTIGARGNIIITDDLVYQNSDRRTGKPAPNSTSMLGLIAENNVLVNKNSREARSDGGIRINACVVALDSSFTAIKLNRGEFGTMHFYGSITEKVRGIVGVVRPFRIGYTAKAWHYDIRLKDTAPPHFSPLVTESGHARFEVVDWERTF